ncbi:phosphoenolpyruvate carboxylase [Candidatus Gottesmanbacteria bacterium RIFCSPHIGHO2_01_FULL_39_10]|uniref:Phosphoenolpyruvate carboxylase n=1 Tax=Candidatus Gottesmanbacteria bacterium RIFCSPHIGHO2_01_FULL_39_10 TaxID=1798375 RepID=A0A1F5ZSN9_9BACT|nr:MAG: phosphoenolpyruvate carboxylase [Candidatus Gottesmanbacteria bacterium RIFCSPHIGHO2_01_FULL_39_10]
MRKIPATMATQHPDNAGRPFWQKDSFVTTREEIEEAYVCFKDLGITEYNWDWEGKYVDESVVDKLLHKYYNYFKRHSLGEDNFLTFRIPNPRVEKQFRLARAFMVIVTSSQLAESLGFKKPPIFETILPLTETAEEVFDIQEAFKQLVSIDHRLLKMQESIQNIEIIPLFEQVEKMMHSDDLLRKYVRMLKEQYGFLPSYIRPYCARSDPALNSGLVPTVLAVKVALSKYRKLEQELGVRLYPMVGTGSLSFRGGLAPDNIDYILDEYAGVRTFTVQSAFRYDYPKSQVKKAVERLTKELPKAKAKVMPDNIYKKIEEIIPFFEISYRKSIENLAPIINAMSADFPRRRERLQHIGIWGYSRGVGKVKLPRAIPFTGALYSLGIPPEIISTGRGIKKAKKEGIWQDIAPLYPHLIDDLEKAGCFLNKENVNLLAKEIPGCYDLNEDIKSIEEEFHIELGPKSASHKDHYKTAQKVYKNLKNKKNISQLITYAGILRKSLG